jgi:hypothetical protein
MNYQELLATFYISLKEKPTRISRFRAAFEFRKAKSIAAWSIRARFVASGSLTSKAVKSWEGPWGAS